MYLEAVTVCIDFSDYLKKCLANKMLFDRWLIVTTAQDGKTIKLCEEAGLEYVVSQRIYEDGAYFNKGKAINEGLRKLEKQDWILHVDADIKLPTNFRKVLESASLNQDYLYMPKFRYIHASLPFRRGYDPNDAYGYCQLFHSSRNLSYPESSLHAAGSDRDFAAKFGWRFDPEKLKGNVDGALIQYLDMSCDHFGDVCVNWKGRKRGFEKWFQIVKHGIHVEMNKLKRKIKNLSSFWCFEKLQVHR